MINWLGHASFVFQGSKTVYTDPYQLKKSEPKADIILVTHDHFDHFVPEDIEKIAKEGTVVVVPDGLRPKAQGLGVKVQCLKPGESTTIGGVKIEAVPAYNINKQFHPKSNNWLGYIFTLDGERIYQAGDTDLIPEMKNIKADIVILPVGGTYTMTAEEAAEAVNLIKPKLAIPMHYGTVVGSSEDAERFKKLCKCEVKVFNQ